MNNLIILILMLLSFLLSPKAESTTEMPYPEESATQPFEEESFVPAEPSEEWPAEATEPAPQNEATFP